MTHDALSVRVISGSNLARGSVFDKSDPFVVAMVGGVELARTSTLYDTIHPVWDEQLLTDAPIDRRQLRAERHEPAVRLRIFDYDRASQHDPLGDVVIEFDGLVALGINGVEEEHIVEAVEDCDHASGELKLIVKCARARARAKTPVTLLRDARKNTQRTTNHC